MKMRMRCRLLPANAPNPSVNPPNPPVDNASIVNNVGGQDQGRDEPQNGQNELQNGEDGAILGMW